MSERIECTSLFATLGARLFATSCALLGALLPAFLGILKPRYYILFLGILKPTYYTLFYSQVSKVSYRRCSWGSLIRDPGCGGVHEGFVYVQPLSGAGSAVRLLF